MRSNYDYIVGELPEPHDFHLLISEVGEAWNDQFHPSPESATELIERLFTAITSGKEWTPAQTTEILQRLAAHIGEYRANGSRWSWEA
jgi:hypothetical protein